MNKFDLNNRTAVITGGAQGFGLDIAKKFLNFGAKVIIWDIDEKALQSAVKEINNPKLSSNLVDISNFEIVNKTVIEISKVSNIDILVNNAGITGPIAELWNYSINDWNKVVEINLNGTFNVLRLAAFEMGKNEPEKDGECGIIINTASVAAFDGQIGQAAYSASKGGVVAMTLPITRDLARMGIRVNTIAPGIFDTPMMAMATDQVRLPLIEMTQFPKRLGLPDEYASLVKHIVENSFLNGETIRLDGAIRMQPK